MKSRSLSLTGATGFVGWHTAEAYLKAGWEVRAIVRRGNRRPAPEGVTVVEAELSAESLAAASAGSDLLIHSAALIRAGSEAAFNAVNVNGTRAAAEAAARNGIRMVLISSQAAGGEGTPDAPRSEDDAPAPVNAYGRSKLASEAVVREVPGLDWIILRPCAVFGPRDHGFLPLFKLAHRGLFLVPASAHTCFTLIYVDDLVRAIMRAAESDTGLGQSIFLGHAVPRTGVDVLRAIAEVEGKRFRPWPVPAPIFTALARLGDLSWKLGVMPMVDSGRLVELRARGFVCSVERARTLLGFNAETSLEAGIAETGRWYRGQGWI